MFIRVIIVGIMAVTLSACGGGGLFNKSEAASPTSAVAAGGQSAREINEGDSSILGLFSNTDDPNTTIRVNKYIWNAALDVLSFLPIEGADPFSGVITTGWGRAQGSSRSYRATIYIQDPALDARSLRVALLSRSGPASKDTIRAIEDAILTRARQLRIADGKL